MKVRSKTNTSNLFNNITCFVKRHRQFNDITQPANTLSFTRFVDITQKHYHLSASKMPLVWWPPLAWASKFMIPCLCLCLNITFLLQILISLSMSSDVNSLLIHKAESLKLEAETEGVSWRLSWLILEHLQKGFGLRG